MLVAVHRLVVLGTVIYNVLGVNCNRPNEMDMMDHVHVCMIFPDL